MATISENAVMWMFMAMVVVSLAGLFVAFSLAKLVITHNSVLDEYRRPVDTDASARTVARAMRDASHLSRG